MLLPTLARAQATGGCTTDVQCKGDRICVKGRCRNPPARRSDGVVIDDGSAGYGDPGWTQGAGILGLVGVGVVLGLGGAAAATSDEQIPALPLGGAATVIGGVLFPIVASGARSGTGRGPLALKIVGWVSYGIFLANAVALIGLGAAEADIEYTAPIVSTTAFGALSGVFFSIDAFLAHGRSQGGLAAVDAPPREAAARRTLAATAVHRPAFGVAFGQVRDTDAEVVPTLGFQVAY